MSEDKKNFELFSGKTLSDLYKDIYNNSKNTSNRIEDLVNDLKKLVNNLNDAVVIVPLIKEYLDVKVKNDEHLVKLSDTIQRLLRNEKTESNELLPDVEKEAILQELRNEQEKAKDLDNEVEKLKNKTKVK